MTETHQNITSGFHAQHHALFLDRDGVINVRKEGGYILHPDEFVFIDGVLQSMQKLALHFGHIFMVTNQRGIGKGLMDAQILTAIHDKMMSEINKNGGRIDRIYYCPDIEESSPDRKPNPGMGLKAKQDFPSIEWAASVMVGDSLSDMRFGRTLGMKTVFIAQEMPAADPAGLIDVRFDNLRAFADSLD